MPLNPRRRVLRSGLAVLAQESCTTPAVTILVGLRAGAYHDPPGHEGTAALLARTLDRGTQTRTAAAIADDLDGRGASLSVVAGACGGCGAYPTAADIRSFRNRWLDEPRYKQRLLDPNATAMGFAMQASGAGRKTAALVLGTAR